MRSRRPRGWWRRCCARAGEATLSRSAVTRSLVAPSCGAESGKTWKTAVSPCGLMVGARDGRDAGRAARAPARRRRAAGGLAAWGSCTTTGERPVEALAEALGEQVVGLARRRAGGVVAGVAEVHPHRQRGHRDHEHDRQPGDRGRPRVAADQAAPSAARSRPLGALAGRRGRASPGAGPRACQRATAGPAAR